MPNYYYFLIAFVQALTEFLPVSSSGHLLLLKGIIHFTEVPILVDITVHLGSLVAIIFFFRHRLMRLVRGATQEIRANTRPAAEARLILYLIFSTGVTGFIFILLRKNFETSFHEPGILPVTFVFTSLLLLLVHITERKKRGAHRNLTWTAALLVGVFQGLAILPGVSRSGATIALLLIMGIQRDEAVFYSFALAIPAIIGGFLIELPEAGNSTFLADHWLVLSGSLLVSAVFSYFFLRLLTILIYKRKFWFFSLYTALAAVCSGIFFW